jgi:hypothetical protein
MFAEMRSEGRNKINEITYLVSRGNRRMLGGIFTVSFRVSIFGLILYDVFITLLFDRYFIKGYLKGP